MVVFHKQGKGAAEQMAKSEPFITGHDDRGGGGQAEAQPLFITITLCHATVQTSKLAGFQHRQVKQLEKGSIYIPFLTTLVRVRVSVHQP